MYQYIKSNDIREIYQKIQIALINKGPEICKEFGQVYQLNLTPRDRQIGDEDFVKFYTVDLKKGTLTLAFERDQYNVKKVPRADVIFNISEEDFVQLYNGNKKTAIAYVLQGKLKLQGSYPLTLKFYQKFLTQYVKNPDGFVLDE